ncbi:MAG TPA: hypothetical protein VFA20_01690 [Myxococcaceae bacterium]|nr:hypothetical protein [Myxococcaceae bacterium]
MSRKLALTFAAISLGVIAFVVAVAVAAGPYAVQELMREKSPIAWLSTMLLVGSSAVSLVLFMRSRGGAGFGALSAALAVAAMDERFMFHERLKHQLLARAFDYDKAAMGHWGDAPMALVPLVGAGLIWLLRGELRGRLVRGVLAVAFAVGVVAIGLDIATEAPVAQAVEEVLEVVAETLFLLALLARVSAGD